MHVTSRMRGTMEKMQVGTVQESLLVSAAGSAAGQQEGSVHQRLGREGRAGGGGAATHPLN